VIGRHGRFVMMVAGDGHGDGCGRGDDECRRAPPRQMSSAGSAPLRILLIYPRQHPLREFHERPLFIQCRTSWSACRPPAVVSVVTVTWSRCLGRRLRSDIASRANADLPASSTWPDLNAWIVARCLRNTHLRALAHPFGTFASSSVARVSNALARHVGRTVFKFRSSSPAYHDRQRAIR